MYLLCRYINISQVLFKSLWIIEDMVGAEVERRTAALRVAGSLSTRNKNLNGLQVVVPGLAVCVCVTFLCFYAQPRHKSVGQRFFLYFLNIYRFEP